MATPSPLTVSMSSEDGDVVMDVAGELDMGTAGEFEGEILAALLALVDDGSLVIDLSKVTFMDSSALRVLIGTIHSCRQRNARLVVRNPSPTVAHLLDITQIGGELVIETT